MKRLALCFAFLFLLQGVAMAQFTNHPRYAQIQTLLNALINSVHDAEALYFQANGIYFQGIITPDAPLDGLTDATANWAVKPFYQTASWKDFAPSTFKTNFKVPFQISITQYVGPFGYGWILMIDVYISGLGPDSYGNDGNHWRFFHHEGPNNLEIPLDEWIVLLD